MVEMEIQEKVDREVRSSGEDELSDSSLSSGDLKHRNRKNGVKENLHLQYFNSSDTRVKAKHQLEEQRESKETHRPLAELKLPSAEAARRTFQNNWEHISKGHDAFLKNLLLKHCKKFRKFDIYLRNGFSLLFYGLGSKKELLENFAKFICDKKNAEMDPILIVHGYTQKFSLNEFLDKVATKFFGIAEFPSAIKSPIIKCRYLAELAKSVKHLAQTGAKIAQSKKRSKIMYDTDIFNFIWKHLDTVEGWNYFSGRSLNSWSYAMPNVRKLREGTPGEDLFHSEQELIEFIEKNRKDLYEEAIRCVGDKRNKQRESVCNVGEPLYKTRHLYIVFHNIDGENVRPPEVQTAIALLAQIPVIHLVASVDHVNSALLWDSQQADLFNWIWYEAATYQPMFAETKEYVTVNNICNEESKSGTESVLRSLTPNHVQVIKKLANYILEDNSRKEMEFQLLLETCTSEMLISNATGLKKLLEEFTTHKLVGFRRDDSGRLLVQILLSREAMKSHIIDFEY